MDCISCRTVNAGSTSIATTYGYLAGGHGAGSTTPLVQTITQSGTTLTYTYDDAGNITSVSDGSKTISYEYDLLGQLTRVNDPYDTTAGTTGTTWKYVYDQGGNIQSKTAYAFTTGTVDSAVKTDSFTYGDTNWKDKLTAFNGQTITYDAIGNPTNDGTWNYTWIGGRQMRAMYKGEFGEQGYDEITFEYNEDGLRTKKTRMYYDDATGDIGYKATNYTLHGKNIVHLSDGSNNLHFFYDAQNKPAVVIYNGTAYAYLYNLQGDVIGLVDSTGTKMVSYTYDAWGKPISKTGTLASTLGTIQPFRYRGYVYDEETDLYYLRSRYYVGDFCRFVNADDFTNMAANRVERNVFAYAANSPILRVDYKGYKSEDMSVWGGIMDVFGAFHITAGVGIGLRLKGQATIGGVPFEISAGGKAEPISIDWGDGHIVVGGTMAHGADITVAGKKFLHPMTKAGQYTPITVGTSVFHPYGDADGCTCKNLTYSDMKDCPAASHSELVSGQIGIGAEVYLGVGASVGAYVDVIQLDRGLKKIINGIADWFGNLF